jgi:hypothetical protein
MPEADSHQYKATQRNAAWLFFWSGAFTETMETGNADAGNSFLGADDQLW